MSLLNTYNEKNVKVSITCYRSVVLNLWPTGQFWPDSDRGDPVTIFEFTMKIKQFSGNSFVSLYQ